MAGYTAQLSSTPAFQKMRPVVEFYPFAECQFSLQQSLGVAALLKQAASSISANGFEEYVRVTYLTTCDKAWNFFHIRVCGAEGG